MSQKRIAINKNLKVNINLNVNLIYFTNHNGMSEDSIKQAIQEFESVIKEELTDKLIGSYYSEEFLKTADFVTFDVDQN